MRPVLASAAATLKKPEQQAVPAESPPPRPQQQPGAGAAGALALWPAFLCSAKTCYYALGCFSAICSIESMVVLYVVLKSVIQRRTGDPGDLSQPVDSFEFRVVVAALAALGTYAAATVAGIVLIIRLSKNQPLYLRAYIPLAYIGGAVLGLAVALLQVVVMSTDAATALLSGSAMVAFGLLCVNNFHVRIRAQELLASAIEFGALQASAARPGGAERRKKEGRKGKEEAGPHT